MESLELTKKRKADDEDDEMMLLIFPALYLHLMGSREKIKRHSSILYGKNRVRKLLNGHIKSCRTAFRMEPQIFRWLASYLRNEGLILDTRLKVEEKLAFFLYMLSHNASFEDLQIEFEHSNSTFHTYIKEFFNIIPILATRFVRSPNIAEPHHTIATSDRFFPYFQNCIGAIDGSHVPVSLTYENQAPWRNRKGSLSQNVMFACDFDMNVTFISCGWEGSATDARVLSSAMLKGFHVPPGKFYLVDGGYANTQLLLLPSSITPLKCFHQYEEWLDNEEEYNIDPRTFVNLPNDGHNLENNFMENNMQGNNLRDQIAWQMWNDFQQQHQQQ